MSFRLNEKNVITKVIEGIPSDELQLTAHGFPFAYLVQLLTFLAEHMEHSIHLEHQQLWVYHLLTAHGQYLRDNSLFLRGPLRNLLKVVTKWHTDMAKL
jgi:periodic tryptophan protein 2